MGYELHWGGEKPRKSIRFTKSVGYQVDRLPSR
jgi:hypothetical protein